MERDKLEFDKVDKVTALEPDRDKHLSSKAEIERELVSLSDS